MGAALLITSLTSLVRAMSLMGVMDLWAPGLLGSGLLGLAPPPAPAADMVVVAAGPFARGSIDGEPDERPVRRLSLPAFAIDRTEVTVEAYAACVRVGACPALPSGPTPALDGAAAGRASRLPVVGVSWTEAAAFCAWAGKRLPTEDEWEKAARGSDGRRYPWGDKPECQRANFGNFAGDGRCAAEGAPGRPVAVGSFPSGASPYGALDLAGNVWEWVADRYRADAYARPAAPSSGAERPSPKAAGTPPTAGTAAFGTVQRVLRGGGCCSIFGLPRAADRLGLPEGYRDVDIGFRCARSPDAAGLPGGPRPGAAPKPAPVPGAGPPPRPS